jgi:hypothetical protein
MKEIELIDDNPYVKADFYQDDFYVVDMSLCELLEKYNDIELAENHGEILEQLRSKHEILYDAFHGMRRAFRNRKKYWVLPLNKGVLQEKLIEGKKKYPDAKCRFLQFTFDNKNNAKFSFEPVGEFGFKSGLSCYLEPLLEHIIETYDSISVVKGLNNLTNENTEPVKHEGKNYNGKFNIAMLKCKLKEPTGRSEKDNFHYYDVVHDPGGNC